MTKSKSCLHCHKNFPLHHYEKKKSEKNYRNICKSCRKHNRQSLTRLKREHLKTHPRPAHNQPCAICEQEGLKLVFDHCHKTGNFRGWICRKCNTGLGQLGDTLECIERSRKYLIRARQSYSNNAVHIQNV